MKNTLLILFLLSFISSCAQSYRDTPINKEADTAKGSIQLKWVNSLAGDYSFTSEWEYPGYRYMNEHGQLVCDGFCPEEINHMKDTSGKIKEEFIRQYYQLVDTSHEFHTLDCEADTYEFSGAYFMDVERSQTNIHCSSRMTVSTHSVLHLYIRNDSCFAFIDLRSIVLDGDAVFYATKGFIKIDRKLFEQGIMKAEFDIEFGDNPPGKKEMFWRGKVYSTIEKE